MASFLFTCSHGAEDPERATVPFNAATVAAASGHEVTVVCTIEAVRLGTVGGADGVVAEGQMPLAELISAFVDAGGALWLCSACTGPRGITDDDLRSGASIVGAASIVELVADGARTITLA